MMMSPICRKVRMNNTNKTVDSVGKLPFEPVGSGGMTIDWGFYLNRPFLRPRRNLGFRARIMEILANLYLRKRKASVALPRKRETIPSVSKTIR